MKLSISTALLIFTGIGVMALLTLTGPLRAAVLVLLAGLSIKTYIAYLKRKQEQAEEQTVDQEQDANEGDHG